MNRREITDLINEIEEMFPVDTWVVDDIHVWPLIRIPLAMNLYELSSPSGAKVISKNVLSSRLKQIPSYLAGWLRQYLSSVSDLSGNQKQISDADVFFFNHTTCRFLLNNAWYDVFCGPLQEELDDLDLTSTIFEFAPRYEYRIPRYQKSSYIQNGVDAIKIIGKLISTPNLPYCLNKYSEACDFILRKSGIKISTIPQLLKQTYRIKRLALFWKRKLRVVHPQIVFMVTYYGDLGMALNLACFWLDIPSVDIQHGVQGDYHVAYGRWLNVPNTGYELLPNIFWCWSEDEKNAIEQWNTSCPDRHRVVIGGNPWLNMWKDDNNNIVKQYDQMLYEQMHNMEGQINILYTLQPGYDPPEWFLDYIISAPPTWKWWVRLHPGMSLEKKRIKDLFSQCHPARIDIDNATIMPLPSLLRHVSLHITQFSTTVIEAAEFGVPSIILDKDGVLSYRKLIESGHAKYAMDVKSLVESMEYYIINKNGIPATNNITTDNVLFMLLENKSPEKGKVPIN
jgi:hypothetical protein